MKLGIANLSFLKPTGEAIDKCLRGDGQASYAGLSEDAPPLPGIDVLKNKFVEDYDAFKIGKGKAVYAKAKEAVNTWQHLDVGWVDSNRPKVKSGLRYPAIQEFLGPKKVLNLKAIELGYIGDWPCQRYDVGATCLEGHALAGEERWSVQWNKEDDTVWYGIYAFSRPNSVLAWAAYPLCRYYQRKFRQDSASHLKRILN